MKGKVLPYVTLGLAVFVLITVNYVLSASETNEAALEKVTSNIEAVSAEVKELTSERDALALSYQETVGSAGPIDISGQVEDVPKFVWLDDERYTRDVGLVQSVGEAYRKYRLTEQAAVLSEVNLDVSKLIDDFLPVFDENTKLSKDYTVAAYKITPDEAISYYARLQYTNKEANSSGYILLDVTTSKSGRVLGAVAHGVYPE